MQDPEYAILHEITHQIKLETEQDAYMGKRDQTAQFKKLENKLVEKYMYSRFSKILWESINELTQKEQRIKNGKPGNTYYVYYKGQFAVDYDMFGMSGVDRFYREKFKVRKVKGSSFNPDFIIITMEAQMTFCERLKFSSSKLTLEFFATAILTMLFITGR